MALNKLVNFRLQSLEELVWGKRGVSSGVNAMDNVLKPADQMPEAKRAWVEPELKTLNIDKTLGGTIPNQAETFTAGNSGNFGRGS